MSDEIPSFEITVPPQLNFERLRDLGWSLITLAGNMQNRGYSIEGGAALNRLDGDVFELKSDLRIVLK